MNRYIQIKENDNAPIKLFDDEYSPDNKQYKSQLRSCNNYQQFRKAVIEKDNGKCIVCGSTQNIEVHHIYPFSKFFADRFNVNTGICLCKEHHSSSAFNGFHRIFGVRDNTPEQLEQYVNTMRQILGNYEPFDVYKYMNPIDADDMELDDSMFDFEF